MDCTKCRELFSPYYDGELKGVQETQFIEHLRSCPGCKREFAAFSQSLGALKSLAGEMEIPGIAEAVRERVSSGAEGQAARWHALVAGDMRDVSEMLRPARGGLLYIASAAAAVLFAIILGFSLLSAPQQPPRPESLAEVRQAPKKPGPARVFVPQVTQEGMVRVDGQWVTKEEAFAAMLKEKGYIRHKGWLVPGEDAPNLAMGMVRRGDRWLTPEELSRRLKRSDTAPEVAVVPASAERADVQPPEVAKEQVAGESEEIPSGKELTTEVPKPTDRPVADNKVAAFLATVSPDEFESHEGLTLCSLACQQEEWEGKGSFYTTLADAVDRGLAELKETGEVNKVLVKKQPGFALFSIGGEVFINGWQCRLSGPDVVLSQDTVEALIDVYCAEKGRWEGSDTFSVADYLAVAEVRKRSYSAEEQEDIWQSIKAVRKSLGVYSLNRSIEKLYKKRAVRERIARFEKAFASMKDKLKRKPNIIGFAVLVDGRIVGADVFVNNDLLVDNYDQLIQTYAVEAAIGKHGSKELPAEEEMRAGVGDFMASAARSTYNCADSGNYFEYKITDMQSDLFGYALAAESAPVHISLFADGTGLKEHETVPRAPRILKRAGRQVGKQPTSPKKKELTPQEKAAAKLLREGKIKPRVPMPPAPPRPRSLPRRRGNHRVIVPGPYGR